MKYSIVSKKNKESEEVRKSLYELLNDNEYEEFSDLPEIVFSIGGDGTFLRAVNLYMENDPIFIGINTGNLGFLCEFEKNDLNNILNLISKNNAKEVKLIKTEFNKLSYYSLNEIRVESLNGTSARFEIKINDELFENIKADGICISSSLGSSGINKGMGGSLVDSSLEILQFNEKIPVNNRKYKALNSSLVLPGNSVFTISVSDRFPLGISYDSSFIRTRIYTDIKVSLSNKKIKILSNNIEYFKKVKGAFL